MHVLKRQHEPQGKCIRTSGLECLAEMTLRDSGRQGSESFSGVALWATPCDLSCDLSLDTECGRGVGWFSYTSSRKRKDDKQSKRKKHNNITTHTLFKPCEAKSAATDMNRWNGTAYTCMHTHTHTIKPTTSSLASSAAAGGGGGVRGGTSSVGGASWLLLRPSPLQLCLTVPPSPP